jgi:hypothetical protein
MTSIPWRWQPEPRQELTAGTRMQSDVENKPGQPEKLKKKQTKTTKLERTRQDSFPANFSNREIVLRFLRLLL